jgi:acetoacetyl-CoA reductase
MRTVENAVVIITGASRGIGRGIAEEFGHGGARVTVNYSHSKEQAEALVKLVEKTIDKFGRIDVLINNAGINIDRTLKNMSVQDWRTVIETDLSSYFYMIKAALNHFIQQKSGTIINMSSIAGQAGNYGQANYSAAKAGILGLTKTAALELARYNVTVNAICPGPIETEMWHVIPAEAKAGLMKKIVLNRAGTVQEVARAARYLYEDGEYYTGATLTMNGGWYMP